MPPTPPRILGLALLAAIGLGCGPSASGPESPTPPVGPRGGPLARLPGGKGFAELLSEAPPGSKASPNVRIVAYFYGPDLEAPPASPPGEVVVRLRLPDAEPVELPLSPEPKAGDRPGASRFASKAGPYAVDRLIGELSGTVDGEPFREGFAGAR